jgi:hypothetical protein
LRFVSRLRSLGSHQFSVFTHPPSSDSQNTLPSAIHSLASLSARLGSSFCPR